jgi:hypothetical protein
VDECATGPFFDSLTGRPSVLVLQAMIGFDREKTFFAGSFQIVSLNDLLDVKCRAPGI